MKKIIRKPFIIELVLFLSISFGAGQLFAYEATLTWDAHTFGICLTAVSTS